ncbi:hypothetical protein FQA47_014373 [Oryzias melastigma]|uniref:Uncharacterized protein n=1 Tax=Oryzias melastigma TaxID=30732 RepID=A0A834CAK5_ORYME|nr:hypothetical protein FQA47_014373 [Oryzias melastigma]
MEQGAEERPGQSLRVCSSLLTHTLPTLQHPSITRCSGAKPHRVCAIRGREGGGGMGEGASSLKADEGRREKECARCQGGRICVETSVLSDMRKSVSSSSKAIPAPRFRLG